MEELDIKKFSPFALYKLYKESLYDYDLGFKNAYFTKDEINFINRYTHLWSIGEYRQARLKYQRLYGKRSRIKKDISRLLSRECIFLTLTFNEKYINMDNKRRKINEWLRKLKCNYIGNVDFGEDNGRIHYHVIVQCDKVDYSTYKYGAINGKRIVVNNVDALKRYLVKLTNHACKESTKREERILKSFKYGLV